MKQKEREGALAPRVAALEADVERIDVSVHELQTTVTEDRPVFEFIQCSLNGVDRSLANLNQKTASLEETVQRIDGRLTGLEDTVQRIDVTLTRLDERQLLAERRFDRLETLYMEHTQRFDSIEATLALVLEAVRPSAGGASVN